MSELLEKDKSIINAEQTEQIINFIKETILNEPTIKPNQIHDLLIQTGLIDINSDEYPFGIIKAQEIDMEFFGHCGGYWLDAYDRIESNTQFKYNGYKCISKNCGIFTFDYDFINEKLSNENLSDENLSDENLSDEENNFEKDSSDEEELYDKNQYLENSKQFKKELYKFIESKLISNPEIKPTEMFLIIQTQYPEYGNFNLLTLKDAKEIDNEFYYKGGVFFRSAFDYPNEGETIKIGAIDYVIENSGIFTCNLTHKL